MKLIFFVMLMAATFYGGASRGQQVPGRHYLGWRELSPVPDSVGFAGSYAGVSNHALIVAGGANFPGNRRPWQGGVKKWYDSIFVLEKPGGQWKAMHAHLPHPMAYGVSLTVPEGLLCIGGGNGEENFTDVCLLQYVNGRIIQSSYPDLPKPLINACGVVLNSTVYVMGGVETPQGLVSTNHFWSLDLADAAGGRGWKDLGSLPGPSRMLAVAGGQDGVLYLFGGVHMVVDTVGISSHRAYLKDAWKYEPAKGWSRVADLPYALAGVPGPAFAAGQSHLLLLGGDDGILAPDIFTLKDRHPGFSNKILSYHTVTDKWVVADSLPVKIRKDADVSPEKSEYAPVTTPLVIWDGHMVLAGGEVRPSIRTNRVWMASVEKPASHFGLLNWGVIVLYFLVVIGIGIWASRKMNGSTGNFFLGGQKIPGWAAGVSIFGTVLSSLTFISIPAKVYATDWAYILVNAMILAVVPLVVIFYLPYFRKLKLASIYEYLQMRFNLTVKLIASFTFVLFQVCRLGIVIYLPALVLHTITGMNTVTCILVISLVTTAYSVSGGIEAVIWTDVMQVFVLLGGALVSLFFILKETPGSTAQLFEEAFGAGKFKVAHWGWDISQPVLWVIVIGSFLGQLVTYTSDQVVVQRYLTTPTEKEARKSIYTNALLTIPASLLFFGIGTGLWLFYRHHPARLNPYARIDDVFPWFIVWELPVGVSGLVIAGLFAAAMSTISSSINSISTVITTDFYRLFKPGMSERQSFRFARWMSFSVGVLGGLIGIYLMWLNNPSSWSQFLAILGLFGGCLAGLFVAGIFFKKITSTGIITGFLITALILYVIELSGKVSFFLYPVIGILGCVLIGQMVSSLVNLYKVK